MNVSLTPELEELVHNKVNSGRYSSASEVVREALRLMDDQERVKSEIRKKIAEGVACARAGDVSDGDAFMDQMLAELDEEIAQESLATKPARTARP